MTQITINADIQLSPEQVAQAFWNLDDSGQAEFFSRLENIAGIKLCMQMAYVSDRIIEARDRGDYSGWHAFQTIAEHSQSLWRSALDQSVSHAKREIREMTGVPQ